MLYLIGGLPNLRALVHDLMLAAPMTSTASWQLLGFLVSVIFFHSSEYMLAIFFHGRSNVTFSSLLISKNYVIAMTCALLEYAIESLFFPSLKEHWWVTNIGLLMVLFGELIRKAAVLTAGQSFTHMIRRYHEDDHELITHGIYRFIRHPGYSGFFIWATGTQIRRIFLEAIFRFPVRRICKKNSIWSSFCQIKSVTCMCRLWRIELQQDHRRPLYSAEDIQRRK